MHVSGSIRSGRGWEGHISLLLIRMLKNYGQGAILLDIGTNIGSHALYGAINNFLVFGVEPQTVNLVKVSLHYHKNCCLTAVKIIRCIRGPCSTTIPKISNYFNTPLTRRGGMLPSSRHMGTLEVAL